MDTAAKVIVLSGVVIFKLALLGAGLWLAYISYGRFQAGQILEAMYMLMAASILILRK